MPYHRDLNAWSGNPKFFSVLTIPQRLVFTRLLTFTKPKYHVAPSVTIIIIINQNYRIESHPSIFFEHKTPHDVKFWLSLFLLWLLNTVCFLILLTTCYACVVTFLRWNPKVWWTSIKHNSELLRWVANTYRSIVLCLEYNKHLININNRSNATVCMLKYQPLSGNRPTLNLNGHHTGPHRVPSGDIIWWIFDRASWYRIEILQPTWCTIFFIQQ
jgi:hypothetical protein